MGVMLSAFADEYSRELGEQLRFLRENGVGAIEPRFIGEKNIADLTTQEAKALRVALGDIRVSAIGSPLGKISLADAFAPHLEKAKRVFETANLLGTGNVRVFSFYLRPGQTRADARAEVLERMDAMLTLAEGFGVTLCHENEADIYGESPEDCLDLLDAFGGRLRCVFDMGNFVLGGYAPWPEAYEQLKGYVEYFHVKDALSQGAIVPPGCGEGCIGEILGQFVRETGRGVFATLEPHLQTFDGLNALTERRFENPYVYKDQRAAFADALRRFRALMLGKELEA